MPTPEMDFSPALPISFERVRKVTAFFCPEHQSLMTTEARPGLMACDEGQHLVPIENAVQGIAWFYPAREESRTDERPPCQR